MCLALFVSSDSDSENLLNRVIPDLQNFGHSIFYASNPGQALTIYHQQRIDAIIINTNIGMEASYSLVKNLRTYNKFLPLLITYPPGSDLNKLLEITKCNNHILTSVEPCSIFDINSFLKRSHSVNQAFIEKDLLNAAMNLWKRPIVIFDRRSRKLLFANKACLNIVGLPEGTIIANYCVPDFLAESSLKDLDDRLNKLYQEGFSSGVRYLKSITGEEIEVYADSYVCNGFVITLISYDVSIERNLKLLETMAQSVTNSEDINERPV